MSRHTEPSHELRSRERAFEQEVKTNLTRNYIAHFVHGMLGMTGFRMIYAPTFVPAYLYLLSDSAFMVGLGLALLQIGAVLSPIVGASQIEHKTRVLSVAIKTGILMRVQILGLALAGWFLLGNVLIVVTFIFLFFLGFFNGSQRVIFQVLLAKVIPIEKRGRLQAWRNFVGGAIAAALSYWAGAHLIEANVLGNGYATTFMLSLILTCFGLAAIFFLIREPESPSVRRQMSLRKRIRQFPILLQDNNYRHYLVSLLLTTAGRIAVPFCIIYAGEKVEVDGAAIGLFTVAFLGADTVSSLVWGTLGDRHGFRVILLSAIITWICALLLIIFAQYEWQFLLGFFGLGAAMAGYQMSSTTMVLEFGQRDDIPMRLALSTTAESVMAVVGPLLGGLIAALAGLMPVFIISIVFLLAALLILVNKVRDPRHVIT